MKPEVNCEMCGLKVDETAAAVGATVCAPCALDIVAERDSVEGARQRCGAAERALNDLDRELEELEAAGEHREAWRRAYDAREEVNALDVRIENERAEAAERETRARAAGGIKPRAAIALDARHIHIKRLIWQREEARRDIMSLDRLILEAAERAATAGVTAQEVVEAVTSSWSHEAFVEASRVAAELHREGAEQRQRGGAALEALETARPVEAPAVNVEPLERRLAALDGPEEGETWGAFHARAAAEIIAHYTGADGEEDTRAELREAIDHIVKAADEAAAERGAATVRRVEELLAAHHREIGAALDVMKRGAVVEAMKILNTASGAAAAALTRGPEDPAVD